MQAAPAESRSPGRVVRSAREAASLTREELARRSRVSTSTVARLELSDRLPNTHALIRIAAQLDVGVADLLPSPTEAAS